MPDFQPLTAQLTRIDRTLRAHLTARTGSADASAAAEPSREAGEAVTAVGAIRSRTDAIRALDAVSEFFRRNEPSSPVPLLLQRAKRLVAKDFMEILRDLTPDGVSQAEMIGGLTREE